MDIIKADCDTIDMNSADTYLLFNLKVAVKFQFPLSKWLIRFFISYAENAGALISSRSNKLMHFFLCLFVYDLNNLYGLDNMLNGFFACMN